MLASMATSTAASVAVTRTVPSTPRRRFAACRSPRSRSSPLGPRIVGQAPSSGAVAVSRCPLVAKLDILPGRARAGASAMSVCGPAKEHAEDNVLRWIERLQVAQSEASVA